MALAVSRVRHKTGLDVFEAAVQRMAVLYAAGHRCVVSFSAGKDSGVMLEVCIEAARCTAALPVDVIMHDEEVMFRAPLSMPSARPSVLRCAFTGSLRASP
jgi:predicted phosphoadenosine phosphosulfate sulfurtransferase